LANKNNTRELLLAVATELIYKKGYSGTSIRDVGMKAKMSNSLLYHYFKDKEDILFQIILAESQELLGRLLDIEKRVEDPLDRLKEMFMIHIGHGLKKQSKILVEELNWVTGKRKTTLNSYQQQIYGVYVRQLRSLTEEGRIQGVPPSVAAFSIFGMINWFYKWYKEGGALSTEEVSKALMKVAFYGLMGLEPNNGEV
jgi:AcrR family transcriptional regulator